MQFALNDKGDIIHASYADKSQQYFCPICNKNVIPRKGETNIDHFSHITKCDDHWNYAMSKWHSEWQEIFPEKNREVVIEHNNIKHRADIMAYGYVIEFQHSNITAKEFDERNKFFISCGKKVIWIFDLIDEYKSGRIDPYESTKNGDKYSWKYPKRFLQSYSPQYNKDIFVFFQFSKSKHSDIENSYIERIVWAIHEDGLSNFSRFATSYDPGNAYELFQWIKYHKL